MADHRLWGPVVRRHWRPLHLQPAGAPAVRCSLYRTSKVAVHIHALVQDAYDARLRHGPSLFKLHA